MSLITLICPHCGGKFDLDTDQPLQPFWLCPYCGNRSLMQKFDDTIRLRGIIPTKPAPGTPADPAAYQPGGPEMPPVAEQPHVLHSRPLEDIIAEAKAPAPVAAAESKSKPAEMQPGPVQQPAQSPVIRPAAVTGDGGHAASDSDQMNQLEQLCRLATEAAEKRDLPLFNSFSRLAIDCQPKDPRMYTLRAILTEEADGFARATWTYPGWNELTPRRKTELIAQHFYHLNSALKYSRQDEQQDLIHRIAELLVRQVMDYFTEQAELRCCRRIFAKTFKGRFHRVDLRTADDFANAMQHIIKQTCPIGHEELRAAISQEIAKMPSRVARRLRRL